MLSPFFLFWNYDSCCFRLTARVFQLRRFFFFFWTGVIWILQISEFLFFFFFACVFLLWIGMFWIFYGLIWLVPHTWTNICAYVLEKWMLVRKAVCLVWSGRNGRSRLDLCLWFFHINLTMCSWSDPLFNHVVLSREASAHHWTSFILFF